MVIANDPLLLDGTPMPTRYWLAFVDLFRDPILWRDVLRGVLLQAVYVVVFLGAGWANFMTKDITD